MAAICALSAAAGGHADDGHAAFEHRRDTMKAMGRSLYLGIGRVAKGRAEFGPDTVAAADRWQSWPRRSARCSRPAPMFRTAT